VEDLSLTSKSEEEDDASYRGMSQFTGEDVMRIGTETSIKLKNET